MPQLNPAPWFMTLMLVWFIILLLLKPKIIKFMPPTQPAMPLTTPHTNPWHWTWH